MYVSTDGITEAKKINGKEIDSKGLAQMAKNQDGMIHQRYEQINRFLQKDVIQLHDDATLLVILPRN